jgi:hypothetical protein
MAIIRIQEVGPVVSNCLSHRNSRCKRRHGEGGRAHKKCVPGWGFKTGARLRDAADGRKQKFLSFLKELRSIRYPVTASLYRPFFASGGRKVGTGRVTFQSVYRLFSVTPHIHIQRSVSLVPYCTVQCQGFWKSSVRSSTRMSWVSSVS